MKDSQQESHTESQLKELEHRITQNEQILEYLLTGCPVTTDEAKDLFGAARAAARIRELRKQGFPIKTELIEVPSGKRVAKYSL